MAPGIAKQGLAGVGNRDSGLGLKDFGRISSPGPSFEFRLHE